MKSGFVSLIGRSNAGKSTLINSLLEEKIALVSHKQNATRRKIQAIVMHENNQIIFMDTPGLSDNQKNINHLLTQSAKKAIKDCDVILFVASVFDEVNEYENFLSLKPEFPHIVILNKVDLAKKDEILKKLSQYAKFSSFKAILPYSCKKKIYKKALLEEVLKYLPVHKHYYDSDLLSVNSEKELYRDFILESLYENLSQEVPYCCDVLINNIKDKNTLLIIDSVIITDTNSHKAMLIGKKAQTIKRIGQKARSKIEKLASKQVLLKLFVQVKKDWQKDENFLKEMLNYD